jgi:serine/threonine-protein kinase
MADVFVSYKAEDRRRVHPLVAALEADGVAVWWDAQIGGGTGWRQVIQRELDQARCVIVIWSKRSVGEQGAFVQDEATRAQRRGVYLPILLDKVEPPLGFGEVQALSLRGWKGERSDPRYQAVLADVRATIDREPRAARAAPAESGLDRRLVLAGGGALALAAGAGGWLLLRSGAGSQAIAILPFANLSGDPEQSYFADGLAEELRGALSRLANLKVIGRVSSEAVRGEEAASAARKLGVTSLLTGSVRRSPAMIRVSAQLVDGGDGAQRWAQSYDRSPGDALAVQADIAENVARALSIELGEAERAALAAGGTKNAAAHDLYLQAKALRVAEGGEAAERRVIGLLDAAVALDPNFANAHALKAVNLTILTAQYASSPTAIDSGYAQAQSAARRAIAIAPQLPAAYGALAEVATARLDAPTALAMFERARAAGTADGDVLRAYGRLLAEIGRGAEAVQIAEQFLALEPLASASYGYRALILYYARRYADAMSSARRFLELAPKRDNGHLRIGDCLVHLGKPREALAEFDKMGADNPFRLVGQAIAAAKLGERATADRALAEVEAYGDASSYQQAQILAQRGDKDRAFAALERALSARDPGLIAVRADPYLDPLRSDPRLQTFERRLRLPS